MEQFRNLREQEDTPPIPFDDHPVAFVLFGWTADPDFFYNSRIVILIASLILFSMQANHECDLVCDDFFSFGFELL